MRGRELMVLTAHYWAQCVCVGGWGVGRYGCVWMCAWVFTIRSTLHTTRARHSACVCLGGWLWVCVCMCVGVHVCVCVGVCNT